MRSKSKMSLTDIVVILACIITLIVTFDAVGRGSREHAKRIACQANLAVLGKGQLVYANDYDGMFTVQGGMGLHTWSTYTSGFADPMKNWEIPGNITVGASLYLLIREVDMDPKQFVCFGGGQVPYDGSNPSMLSLTELWDFGRYIEAAPMTPDTGSGNTHGPKNHVSYSYHMPYGPNGGVGFYAANNTKSSSFAVMADKNPWYDPKLIPPSMGAVPWQDSIRKMGPYYRVPSIQKWLIWVANSYPHQRLGQNVLFADGHCTFEETSDAGVDHDSIYTIRDFGGTEDAIRQGNTSIYYAIDNDIQPIGSTDSFLVNDDWRY